MNLNALLSPAGATPLQFEGFLRELWTVWGNNVCRAVLLARWFWQRIPESVVQQAALIQQQTQSFRPGPGINEMVNLKLGTMGIFPASGSLGASYGPVMDPNVGIFIMIMGMIRTYHGDPPVSPTLPGIAQIVEPVIRGERDPVEAAIAVVPPAAGQQLKMAAEFYKQAGFYNVLRVQTLALITLGLPRQRIPALLPEAAVSQSGVELRIRSEAEMKSWLETHRKELSQGMLSARDVVNGFLASGTISEDRFQSAIKTDAKLAKEMGLTEEAAYEVLEIPYAWYVQGDAAGAKPVFLAFTAFAPEAYFENMVGACDGRLGLHEEALAHYERALAINPEHSDALINHARELRCLCRNDESLLEFAKLATAQKTAEERKLAQTAREELEEYWAKIMGLARQKEDIGLATAAWTIYDEVRPKVAAMGIELPEIVIPPAERKAAAESLLKLFKNIKGTTPELIKKLEEEAGVKTAVTEDAKDRVA